MKDKETQKLQDEARKRLETQRLEDEATRSRILTSFKKTLKDEARHVATTTVWNIYGGGSDIDHISKKKGTNLFKTIEKLKKGKYLVFLGPRGYSGHSATKLFIFKANKPTFKHYQSLIEFNVA